MDERLFWPDPGDCRRAHLFSRKVEQWGLTGSKRLGQLVKGYEPKMWKPYQTNVGIRVTGVLGAYAHEICGTCAPHGYIA